MDYYYFSAPYIMVEPVGGDTRRIGLAYTDENGIKIAEALNKAEGW